MKSTIRIYNETEILTSHKSFQSESLPKVIPSRSEWMMKCHRNRRFDADLDEIANFA